jgi:hypothetical protein
MGLINHIEDGAKEVTAERTTGFGGSVSKFLIGHRWQATSTSSSKLSNPSTWTILQIARFFVFHESPHSSSMEGILQKPKELVPGAHLDIGANGYMCATFSADRVIERFPIWFGSAEPIAAPNLTSYGPFGVRVL